MRPDIRMRVAAVCVFGISISACVIDFNADVPCDGDGDCPKDFVCDLEFFRCVDGEPDGDVTEDSTGDIVDVSDATELDASEDGSDETVDVEPDLPVDAPEDADVPPVETGVDVGETTDVPTDVPDESGPDVPVCVPTGPEICDGTDNDCDGVIDNPPVCDGPCSGGMALVTPTTGGDAYCIDLFEASRTDATAESAGVADGMATSRAGVLPWSEIAFDAAGAACTAAGKRLCTNFEWQNACQSVSANLYPYGNAYAANSCNGSNVPPLDRPAPTSSFDECVSLDGIFDMSGNLAEWTAERLVRGGAYDSSQLNLRCTSRETVSPDAPPLPQFGFRCCADSR